MKVQEIMTEAVESCRPATDLAAVAATMWRKDCGIVPVVDESRRVLGVVTDRDICMASATQGRRPDQLLARDVTSREVFSVHPEDDVKLALEAMRLRKVRRLLVVDRENRLQGILSMNDIVLRTKPSGSRASDVPSANDVVGALQRISEHTVSSKPTLQAESLIQA